MAEPLSLSVSVHLDPGAALRVAHHMTSHEFVILKLGEDVSIFVADPAALDQLAELAADARRCFVQPTLPELDAA